MEVAINMEISGFYQKWKNHNKHSKINTFKEVIFKKSSPNWVQDHFLIEKRNITIRGKKKSKYRGFMWKIIDFYL